MIGYHLLFGFHLFLLFLLLFLHLRKHEIHVLNLFYNNHLHLVQQLMVDLDMIYLHLYLVDALTKFVLLYQDMLYNDWLFYLFQCLLDQIPSILNKYN